MRVVSVGNNDECLSSLKCSSVVSEYHQQYSSGTLEDLQLKYSKTIEDMKQQHGREINIYQDKISYLELKVEALEAEKRYLKNTTITNEDSSI